MKRINIIIISIIMLFGSTSTIEASACQGEEKTSIGKEAANVKTSYEEFTRKISKDKYGPIEEGWEPASEPEENYFEIKFMNITRNMRLIITSEELDLELKINYDNTNNGTYVLKHENLSSVTTYKYEIYGDFSTNCYDTKIANGSVSLPMYNIYYNSEKCRTLKDFYLCQKYVTSEVSYKNFEKEINKVLKKNEEQEKNKQKKEKLIKKILSFIKENKIAIILFGSMLLIGTAGYIVFKIMKRKKEIV